MIAVLCSPSVPVRMSLSPGRIFASRGPGDDAPDTGGVDEDLVPLAAADDLRVAGHDADPRPAGRRPDGAEDALEVLAGQAFLEDEGQGEEPGNGAGDDQVVDGPVDGQRPDVPAREEDGVDDIAVRREGDAAGQVARVAELAEVAVGERRDDVPGDEIPHELAAASELQADPLHAPLLAYLMGDQAGPFVGDHAGPQRGIRRASFSEEPAVRGPEDPPEGPRRTGSRGPRATARPVSSPYFVPASKPAYRGRSLRPLPGILPRPRHRASLGSSISSIRARATGLPSGRTTRRYSLATRGLLVPDLVQDRQDPAQDVERLESGDRSRDAEFVGDERVGGFADDDADVAGIEEARDGAFPRLEDGPDGGRDEPQGREHGIVPDLLFEGPADRVGDAGDRGLEAGAEEDDLFSRDPSGRRPGLPRENRRSGRASPGPGPPPGGSPSASGRGSCPRRWPGSKFSRPVTRSIAASWTASGVMQTGQPGPEIISTPASSSRGLRPDLWRAIVCVPQTSMIRTGRGEGGGEAPDLFEPPVDGPLVPEGAHGEGAF